MVSDTAAEDPAPPGLARKVVRKLKPAFPHHPPLLTSSFTFSEQDRQHITSVAWRSTPRLTTQCWIRLRILPKTVLEILFITFAVSETRTGRLSSANTAALYTPIHLRFVKAKHLFLPAVACENKQELVLLIIVRYRKKNLGNSLGKPKVNYNSGWITARSGHSFILHWLRRADAPRMHFLIRRKKRKL